MLYLLLQSDEQSEKRERAKRLALKTYVFCLIFCLAIVVSLIWMTPPEPPRILVKLAMTLFAIGLGAFLFWFTFMIQEIRAKITERE